MKRVAILGAGSWGTALVTLLGRCEEVRLWMRDAGDAAAVQQARENRRYLPGIALPSNVRVTCNLEEALEDAECVTFAVPSGAVQSVAQEVEPFLPTGVLIVSAAKGLDAEGQRVSELLRNRLHFFAERLAVLSGPNLAVEVARGVPTASVAAADDPQTARDCQLLWMGPTFRVYTSSDLTGVELAGAMKNVIAIAAGVCEGVGFGDNSRAALMTRGLAEITRLGTALGAQTSTFLGLAGVGDLIATGGSRLSRNYRVGLGLGQGQRLESILEEIGQVAEGVPTTQAICRLARRTGVEMPISEALHAALFEGAAVRESILQLMLRPARSEVDF